MADENTVEADTSNVTGSRTCESCQQDIVLGDDVNEMIVYCAACQTKLRKQRKKLFVGKVIELYKSCLICLNMFYNNLSYEKHDCTLEGVFVCDGCCKVYLQKESIAKHVHKCQKLISKMNSSESKNNCITESISELNLQNCEGTSGVNESNNDKIMPKLATCDIAQSELPKTRKQFICSICEKCYSRKYTLSIHLRLHTGKKPCKCKYCNKKFTQSSSLISHLRIHTGEKPYECKYCNKKFARSNTLNSHLRSHTGEKPFNCKYCNKKFADSSTLINHIRTHTGEKPHNCKYCNKKFTQLNNLNSHLRTHTGEKPFHCKYCNKKFTQSSHLKRHLSTHRQECK